MSARSIKKMAIKRFSPYTRYPLTDDANVYIVLLLETLSHDSLGKFPLRRRISIHSTVHRHTFYTMRN